MELIVDVTSQDIKRGKRKYISCCPIALALKRSLPGKRIAVGSDITFIGDGLATLPKQARTFIERFDNSESVKPFKFKLSLS